MAYFSKKVEIVSSDMMIFNRFVKMDDDGKKEEGRRRKEVVAVKIGQLGI